MADNARLAQLESVLTDPHMARSIDSVVLRTSEGFRAASARGSVDFCEGEDGDVCILAKSGTHPLVN